MAGVVFNRKWEIKTADDLKTALETLKDDDFIAEMSDCYAVTCSEKAEVSKQRADVMFQAKLIGLIK